LLASGQSSTLAATWGIALLIVALSAKLTGDALMPA
jgi:hypothetical protein